MRCVLQIVLAVLGFFALAKGKFSLSSSRTVQGVPARLVGVLLLLPLPVSIGIGLLYSERIRAQGDPFDLLEEGMFTLSQLGIMVATLLLAGLMPCGFETDEAVFAEDSKAGSA
jgi:hypothetical protein